MTGQGHAGLIALPFGTLIGLLMRAPVRAWQQTARARGVTLTFGLIIVLMALPAEYLAEIRPVRSLIFTAMLVALGDLPGARLRAWVKGRLAPRVSIAR